MDVFEARHRITFTPEGGEPIVLLSPLDWCDAEPALEGGPETQTESTLLGAWVTHHSRGNANVTLSFDCYCRAACLEQAQAAGFERWLTLTTQPEGTLLYETAFTGLISLPLVSQTFHATLIRVNHRELAVDTSPFATPGYHMSYQFTVSPLS